MDRSNGLLSGPKRPKNLKKIPVLDLFSAPPLLSAQAGAKGCEDAGGVGWIRTLSQRRSNIPPNARHVCTSVDMKMAKCYIFKVVPRTGLFLNGAYIWPRLKYTIAPACADRSGGPEPELTPKPGFLNLLGHFGPLARTFGAETDPFHTNFCRRIHPCHPEFPPLGRMSRS